MPPQDSKASTGMFVAAFLVGSIGGAWLLFGFGSSSAATDSNPVASVSRSSSGLEQLQLENQLLAAELEKQQLQLGLAKLRQQAGGHAVSENGLVQVPAPREVPEPAVSPGERTLAFWNEMNNIIDREAQMRTVPAGGVNDNNASRFIDARVAAGEYAVQAFAALESKSVDRDVVALSKQLGDWYAKGVAICKTGQEVLGSDAATRRGQAGLSWKAGEFTHAAAVNALNKQGATVRAAMTKKHGIAFPPLK